MKKILKAFLIAVAAMAAAVCFAGCSQWNSPYKKLDDDGYNVSVKFDANGGQYSSADADVIDVFKLEDIKANGGTVSVLSPTDASRKNNAFSISRGGYVLAGWYTERQPRADENGNALDDYGIPVSESGRAQGFIYSGKWDFNADKLTLDTSKSYTSAEPVLTLYAAWVPLFKYEIYAEAQSGDWIKKAELDSYEAVKLPDWNTETGKMDLNGFVGASGDSFKNVTFECAYSDAEKTQEIVGTFPLRGYIDYEKGIAVEPITKIYTTWIDGEWFRISTSEQFIKNSKLDGNYIICADLDFTGKTWSRALCGGAFNGKIYGNGYKFSNITLKQADNSKNNGGLFGSLTEKALIDNVNFENVSFSVEAGSRAHGGSFGLLSGYADDRASLTGITVSGVIRICDTVFPSNDYSFGLLFGVGNNRGIDISAITCEAVDTAADQRTLTVSADYETGIITVTGI